MSAKPFWLARSGGILITAIVLASPARAEVADHLRCFKMHDPLKLIAYSDDLETRFGTMIGCKLSRARWFCVPSTKTNVSEAVTLPFVGAARPGDAICYKARCYDMPIPEQEITDQFGLRTLSATKAALLCVPAAQTTAYCGDGAINLSEQCEPSDLGGATCTSLGFLPGTLSCAPGCTYDTSGCPAYPDVPTCGNGSIEAGESCDGASLGGGTCATAGYPLGGLLGCTEWCAFDTSGCVRSLPATGQTACWDGDGMEIPCAGTGQDGDVRAGAPRNFVDNGDGTISDESTGLTWEKLSEDGSIHDVDVQYGWQAAFTTKIAALNAPPCFAGHCDWRVPNRHELASLWDFQHFDPCIAPAFNTGCVPGCNVMQCSCTARSLYWSSTTTAFQTISAWSVDFVVPSMNFGFSKASDSLRVRAVRGGS